MTKLLAFLSVLIVSVAFVAGPGQAQSAKQKKRAIASLLVKAGPQTCYEAIRALRDEDPSNVRELSEKDNQCVLEETFEGLPIIGKAKCVYVETYTPGKRIDYRMIESDKFKAFEGSWVLTPASDELTQVELSSFIDTGLPVPFARQITDMQTLKDVKVRLAEVKALAEARQQKLKQGSKSNGS